MTWLRIATSTAVRAARPARLHSFKPLAAFSHRSFVTTPRWRNDTPANDFTAFSTAFQKTSLGQKIMDNQGAQAAFLEFGQALKNCGAFATLFNQPEFANSYRRGRHDHRAEAFHFPDDEAGRKFRV
jgi:hypothetical protein